MDTKSLERSIKTIIKTGQGYGPEFMPVLKNTKNILKRINKGRPTAENFFQLGGLCIKLEDNVLAIEAFESGYQLNKNHVNCGVYYALLLEQKGQWRDALGIYQELNKTDPENVQIVERILSIFYQENDVKSLLSVCHYFLENQLFYPAVYEYISKFYFDCGNIEKAIEYLRNALAIDSENEYYKNRLIHHLFKNNDFQAVMEFSEFINENAAATLASKLLYANSKAETGEMSQARNLYVKILKAYDVDDRHTILAEIALFHINHEKNLLRGNFINNYILKRDPKNINALTNLALTSESEYSIPAYEKVLQQYPDNPLFRTNYGHQLILAGRLEEGFKYSESRIELMQPFLKGRLNYPETLSNKKVFLWNDQGIGDLYIWSWLFKHVEKENITMKIQVDERLIDIMKTSFPSLEFTSDTPMDLASNENFAAYDAEMAFGSFGKYYINEIKHAQQKFEQDGISEPHLTVDVEKVMYWKQRLSKLTNDKVVGVCWRSGLLGKMRDRGYISAENIVETFSDLDCTVVNLQYDHTAEEIEILQSALGERFINFTDLDLKDDQHDVAALIMAIDLVFSVGTAVMALAGALGAKVFCPHGINFLGKPYHIMLPTAECISGPKSISENTYHYKAVIKKHLNI